MLTLLLITQFLTNTPEVRIAIFEPTVRKRGVTFGGSQSQLIAWTNSIMFPVNYIF